jgi:LCP family protein required for cell wall assembly
MTAGWRGAAGRPARDGSAMSDLKPSYDRREAPRRRRWLPLVALLVAGLTFSLSAVAVNRVASFADSVFAGSRPPEHMLEAVPPPVEDDPTPTPTAALAPAPPPVTPTRAAAATPRPAPTATRPPSPTPADPTSILGKLQSSRRVTFLLIGYSGPGHDGPYLTDALVVASFEPRTGQLALFNVPRDLWVRTPNPGGQPGPFRKVNEIYSLGLGGAAFNGQPVKPAEHDQAAWLTAGAVQQVLGLPVDGWVSGDFDAVRKVVDGLGGVTVDVERAFDDYAYPRHDNAAVDPGVIHVHFDAGPQRLTGERALQYARSRNSAQDGTDFARSRRQQRLLLALKDQALTPATLPRLFTLMDALQGNVRTSLALSEARDLLFYGRDRNGTIQGAPTIIDANNLLAGSTSAAGASILIPKAGAGNYTAIQAYVRERLRASGDRARAS